MDDPRTVRVTLTYGNTLTEGVWGWSGSPWMTVRVTLTEGVGGWGTRVTLTLGITPTVRSVRVTLESKADG